MDGDADLAAVAAVVAEPARARILVALGDGRELPASVLAAVAGVSASTASEHLGKLVAAGFLSVDRNGRRRNFRIAGPEIGDVLEALARVAPPEPIRSLREGTRAQALREARTCYDHLAGKLGTELMDALLERGVVADDRVTPTGLRTLASLGVDLDSIPGAPTALPLLPRLEREAPARGREAGRGARGDALRSRLDRALGLRPRRADHTCREDGLRRGVRLDTVLSGQVSC